jgi:general secretion pathway protein D
VTGAVTFNVSHPLSREEILPTLEAVLNSRDATMLQANGMIRVMPLRKKGKPIATAPMEHASASAVGERTEAFPLRFVGASDVQHALENVLRVEREFQAALDANATPRRHQQLR